MQILRTIVSRGWSPLLIIVLAVAGYVYDWNVWAVTPALTVILVIGLVMAIVSARERQLELGSIKLRQLAGYYNRRFMGDSSLSIFAIINSLFNTENPQLWDWARACDMSRRVFNSWGNSFIDRVESDIRARRYTVYLHTYLNELWLLNNHYYEFVEQFYEIADKVEVPAATIDQYNRFVMEYNSFVQNFREIITELKKTARTEIETPSVKLARELLVVNPPRITQEREEKPKTTRGGGYYP